MLRRLAVLAAICALAASAQVKIYNTVKQKLAAGKQVVGATVFSPDPNIYCAMANAGTTFCGSRCSTAR